MGGGNGHSREPQKGSGKGETDSFDSVRLELAGFGEYGSFVVSAEGPAAVPSRRPSCSNDSKHGTEQNERTRATYLPVLPDGCCVSAAEEKLSGNEAERGGGGEKDAYGPVVRNTCLREPVLRVSPVRL